jgi:hypothetical protein
MTAAIREQAGKNGKDQQKIIDGQRAFEFLSRRV